MNQIKKLKQLENLSFFDKVTLEQYYDLSDNSLYANINRWLKLGALIQLRKGLYVSPAYLQTLPDKQPYCEFIANKLREPSYLSLEYVLQKYSILTEAVYAFTSITLKCKRTYSNSLGTFVYRNLKEELFTGFKILSSGRFEVKEATKAKALFDYLYLKTLRISVIRKEFLTSLRLNLDEMTMKDFSEFSKYCKQSGIKKYLKLPKLLEDSGND